VIGRTHRRFWKCFEALPAPVQKLAREKDIAASLILTRFFAVAETNVPDRRTRHLLRRTDIDQKDTDAD